MDEENELSEPSSSHLSENPYRDVGDYLSHDPDSFYIAQPSQSQYFLDPDSQEIEQNEAASFPPNDNGGNDQLFPSVTDQAYQQDHRDHLPTHQERGHGRTPAADENFSNHRVVSCSSLSNSRLAYYMEDHLNYESSTQGLGNHNLSSQKHSRQPCLELLEPIPSTSKGVYKEDKNARKKFRDFGNHYGKFDRLYPDSNNGDHYKVESTEDKPYISPFKKRISVKQDKVYVNSSSESDDDTGLDLSNSICSSRPMNKFVKIRKTIHQADKLKSYNTASTSDLANHAHNILNRSCPTTPGESCLVSSSTGHLESLPGTPSSLQENDISPSSPEESQNPPLLDSTVDSTSGQNLSSPPYSNGSEDGEIRPSEDVSFRAELEDSRDEISTSMSHLQQVEDSGNANMDLLVVSSKSFSENRNENNFISLNNFGPHSIHSSLTDDESNQDVVPSALIPSSSVYFDEQLAIPGPSGVSNSATKNSSVQCGSSEVSSHVINLASDSLDLTVNSASSIQATVHRCDSEPLEQSIDLAVNDIEPESSNFVTSAHLENDFVLQNSDGISHLQRNYASRTLNQLNQHYIHGINDNSFGNEINSEYVAHAKKKDLIKDNSLEVDGPLTENCKVSVIEEEDPDDDHNLQSAYDMGFETQHLKRFLSHRELSQSFVSQANLIEDSQQIDCNELPLGCSPHSKLQIIANQARNFADMNFNKTLFYDDSLACASGSTLANDEESAIDFRTKSSVSLSELASQSAASSPKAFDNIAHSPTGLDRGTSPPMSNVFHSCQAPNDQLLDASVEHSSPIFQPLNPSEIPLKSSSSNDLIEVKRDVNLYQVYQNDLISDTTYGSIFQGKEEHAREELSFWCDECEEFLKTKCSLHRIQAISDKPVPTRAWASLPALYLNIKQINSEENQYGVFARRTLPKRTQFGPLEGKYTQEKPNTLSLIFPVTHRQKASFIDTSETETSNWMRFVRKAENFLEMNCVVIEEEQSIFFLTVADIRPKIELKIGYSKQYAIKYELCYLTPSKEEQEILDSLDKSWACYECDDSFRTSAELQNHLTCHDKGYSSERKTRRRGKKRNACSKSSAPSDLAYQVNNASEIPPSEKSKRIKGPVSCKECSLFFDNSKLLEIHSLAHEQPKQTFNGEKSSFLQNCQCPSCLTNFVDLNDLINHVKNHAILQTKNSSPRSFKCLSCYKAFSDKEKLNKHMEVHNNDSEKPFSCYICSRRFLSKSALGSHLKFHSGEKISQYDCPICQERFLSVVNLKKHFPNHAVKGQYTCPTCNKKFPSYLQIRRHIRAYHTSIHLCPECGKSFPSIDKIKLHKLIHSDKCDFICPICSRGFKRKDKMKEHIKKIHSQDRESRKKSQPKFIPKLSPNDYEQFLYKCHQCMLGFKRRGMLVNHLSRRHPNIQLSSVPELNQPIIRACRSYICQYCKKSYVSSTKRKLHILRCHPGAELPPSKSLMKEDDLDSSASRSTRIIPVSCPWCPRQYATKAKMLQHQRKRHGHLLAKEKGASSNQHDVEDDPQEEAPETRLMTSKVVCESGFPAHRMDLGKSEELLEDKSSLKVEPSSLDNGSDSNQNDILCQALGRLGNNETQFVRLGSVGLVNHPLQQIQIKMQHQTIDEPQSGESIPLDQVPQHIQLNDQLIMSVPSTSNQIFVTGSLEQDGVPALALLTSDGSDTYTLSLRPGHVLSNIGSLSVVSPVDDQNSESVKDVNPEVPQHISRTYIDGGPQVILANASNAEEFSHGFQPSSNNLRNEESVVAQLPSQVVVWQPNSVSFAPSGI